jgi:hypothetical protein
MVISRVTADEAGWAARPDGPTDGSVIQHAHQSGWYLFPRAVWYRVGASEVLVVGLNKFRRDNDALAGRSVFQTGVIGRGSDNAA